MAMDVSSGRGDVDRVNHSLPYAAPGRIPRRDLTALINRPHARSTGRSVRFVRTRRAGSRLRECDRALRPASLAPGPTPAARARRAPASFHVLAKPTGAICNLDCDYCFFLAKEELYPGSTFRMTEPVLEAYISQLLAVAPHPRGDHRLAGR